MSITDDLGEAIERRLKRETRYRIAKDSGVDFAILSRFLSGQRSPRLDTVDRLAEYLGLKLTKARVSKKKKKTMTKHRKK